MTSIARWSPDKNGSWFSLHSRKLAEEDIPRVSCNVAVRSLRKGLRSLGTLKYISVQKYSTCYTSWKVFSTRISLEGTPSSLLSDDESSTKNEVASTDSSEKILQQQFGREELKALLSDSERSKLIKKLSEANQQNRFLKRQLKIKEDALVNFKNELSLMELEIQGLVTLADEVAKTGVRPGSRKINGKYIQSHLISKLEAVHEKVKGMTKDVKVVQSKEIRLHWYDMAESVQVMGSFDGWSQGASLSPENTSSYTQFSTTLMLRPGRYEIKFLIDGEWRLSPELPTVGEGMLENNLLIVE